MSSASFSTPIPAGFSGQFVVVWPILNGIKPFGLARGNRQRLRSWAANALRYLIATKANKVYVRKLVGL